MRFLRELAQLSCVCLLLCLTACEFDTLSDEEYEELTKDTVPYEEFISTLLDYAKKQKSEPEPTVSNENKHSKKAQADMKDLSDAIVNITEVEKDRKPVKHKSTKHDELTYDAKSNEKFVYTLSDDDYSTSLKNGSLKYDYDESKASYVDIDTEDFGDVDGEMGTGVGAPPKNDMEFDDDDMFNDEPNRKNGVDHSDRIMHTSHNAADDDNEMPEQGDYPDDGTSIDSPDESLEGDLDDKDLSPGSSDQNSDEMLDEGVKASNGDHSDLGDENPLPDEEGDGDENKHESLDDMNVADNDEQKDSEVDKSLDRKTHLKSAELNDGDLDDADSKIRSAYMGLAKHRLTHLKAFSESIGVEKRKTNGNGKTKRKRSGRIKRRMSKL